MLDVGHERPESVLPGATLAQLRDRLADPVAYFLGDSFESVLFPTQGTEYYGFPPSKSYIFAGTPPRFRWRVEGFAPLASFARGGLAEAWTAGVYPFNDAELADFPFAYADIAPYYDLVAERIGISGEVDDLARFMPVHQHLLPPLDLDEHSSLILRTYAERRASLNRRLGCYIGRSRIATISRDREGRQACSYLGRCLWGCPSDSLYTPSITLAECRRHDRFRYVSGVYVRYFRTNAHRRITAVVVDTGPGKASEDVPVDTLALGAGTLSSCKIFLESVFRETGQLVTLHGRWTTSRS